METKQFSFGREITVRIYDQRAGLISKYTFEDASRIDEWIMLVWEENSRSSELWDVELEGNVNESRKYQNGVQLS